HVAFSLSGLESDDNGTLTFTDHNGNTAVVTIKNGAAVDGNGNPISSVDLSKLADGSISATLDVKDAAGNEFKATSNTVTLDQDATESPGVVVNGGSATVL